MAVNFTARFNVNAQATLAANAIAANTGYTSPEVNGMTQQQWVNEQFKAWIAGHYAQQQAKAAQDAAYANAMSSLDITIVVS